MFVRIAVLGMVSTLLGACSGNADSSAADASAGRAGDHAGGGSGSGGTTSAATAGTGVESGGLPSLPIDGGGSTSASGEGGSTSITEGCPLAMHEGEFPGVGLSPSGTGEDETFTATVASVEAAEMRLTSDAGERTLRWTGAALSPSFEPGDTVEVTQRSLKLGLGNDLVAIVRSETATAVAFSIAPYRGLDKTMGAKAPLALGAGLPDLTYTNVGCCITTDDLRPSGGCDYSSLSSVGNEAAEIAVGEVKKVGEWTVANLGSALFVEQETAWHVEATMLGPKTAADAGP